MSPFWLGSELLRRLRSGRTVGEAAAGLALDETAAADALRELAGRPGVDEALAAVLRLLADGKSIPEVASELERTPESVVDQLSQAESLAPALCIALSRPGVDPFPHWVGVGGLGAAVAQGALRTMPVRFPERQYQRLKEWCAEHNFPMAVVVRGLVERFLDEQERRAV
jgi:hypothetical protein